MAANKKIKKNSSKSAKKSTLKTKGSKAISKVKTVKKIKTKAKLGAAAKVKAAFKTSKTKPTKKPVKVAKGLILKSKSIAKNITKTTTPKAKVPILKTNNGKAKGTNKEIPTKKPKGQAWMKPLDDRILIEVVEESSVSPGGIILVDSSIKPENIQGFVIAVGRGHQTKKGRIHPVEVKAGDKIIFSKYAGDKVSQDGVNFVIIRESEILGLASN